MHPYPHTYRVSGTATGTGPAVVVADGLEPIPTAPPPEFDGPGGAWSPETLLTAAVADCFMLSFRAISRASRFDWLALDCQVEGVLERLDGTASFTRFRNVATLTVAPGTDAAKARLLLEKAEHICLITNSLKAVHELSTRVVERPTGA
jgi:organic hydroperoxide reductase OsmC/OhrA